MTTLRKIIQIDEEKCNGCGICIPSCAEGALQIVNGKAKLVKEFYCDGLGACLGNCPKGALNIIEREALRYDEEGAMQVRTKKMGHEMLGSRPDWLNEHNQVGEKKKKDNEINPLHLIQPSYEKEDKRRQIAEIKTNRRENPLSSELRQWPVQLALVNPQAPYFENVDLLITAVCIPFAYPDFHRTFLKGKAVVICCPKLDEDSASQDKLVKLFQASTIRNVNVLYMEAPCCLELINIAEEAIRSSAKKIPLKKAMISIRGERT